ncbi:hypothetical protein L6452_00207 [Arctium lappa]|uniref:Uncharacterized protein n=1 Tax=Arctium lappa TaxID=4217 RepID=A0ACB9FDW5_ARCLA|nr:hypothetical protein L6452_00207 [Arctium lappa]
MKSTLTSYPHFTSHRFLLHQFSRIFLVQSFRLDISFFVVVIGSNLLSKRFPQIKRDGLSTSLESRMSSMNQSSYPHSLENQLSLCGSIASLRGTLIFYFES